MAKRIITFTVGSVVGMVLGSLVITPVWADQATIALARQMTIMDQRLRAMESRFVGSNVSGDVTLTGRGVTQKASKVMVISAGDEIVLRTGAASIQMKKDGTIILKGKDISLDGSGKINVKATGDMTLKGSKILQN